jgi:uncharacterized protein YxjI
MRYNIKEKFWGWGDDFHILDDEGRPVFFVDGEAFSWGSKLSFQDMQGRELAFISQKLLTWMPKYEIYRNDNLFAEIVKEFSWFGKEFTLDVPGPNDYTIKGSFWDYHYDFIRGDRVVAQVSRAAWSWTHCYGVEIEDGEDDIAILCAAIVIDQVLHDENKG